MNRLFALILFLLTTGIAHSQITVSITNPQSFALSDDQLTVVVHVTSTFQLDTVRANVGAQETTLSFVSTNNYSGIVNLAGMVQDTLDLIVTAKDVFGNTATATKKFIYDQKPDLVVSYPVAMAVARPGIQVNALATDSLTPNCMIIVKATSPMTSQNRIDTFYNTVNTVIDYSAFNGRRLTMQITAIDSRGQHSFKVLENIFVDSSSYLEDVYKGLYRIEDFYQNRLLIYKDLPGNISQPMIVDLTAADTTYIPFNGKLYKGKLTNTGAVFGAADPILPTNSYLHDWNNDTLFTVPGSLSPGSNDYYYMKVNGNTLVFITSPAQLNRYRFSNRTTNVISSNALNHDFNVAANGMIVYSNDIGISHYALFKYPPATQLTFDPLPYIDAYPRTDGVNICYQRGFGLNGGSELYNFNGADSVFIDDKYGHTSDVYTHLIDNGYFIYKKTDTFGTNQVWEVNLNTGVKHQVSFFGSSSDPESVRSNGSLLFSNGTTGDEWTKRRYYSDSNGFHGPVCTVFGVSFLYNNEWYIAMGCNLYRLHPDSVFSPPAIVNTSQSKQEIKLYPNPAKNTIHVELEPGRNYTNAKADVYNMSGQKVLSLKLDPLHADLDISKLAPGNYILHLTTPDRQLVQKFINLE